MSAVDGTTRAAGGSSPASNAWSDYWPIGLLLLVAGVLFAWGIGSYTLWDPWEPKYAQAVREMGERGDWITPWLNDKIRWTKPILIYWAMYVPTRLFGNTEFAVRLPSVFAALLGMWSTWYAVGRLRGGTIGLTAAAILMTLPQYFYLARQATPDMLMTSFITLALCMFVLARFQPERRTLHLNLFYAAVALGFLTKGPVVGAVVVWTVILFVLPDLEPARLVSPRAVIEDVARLWKRYRVWQGIAIFLVIAGPWYLAMYLKHSTAFIDHFILDENLDRFTEPLFGHSGTTTRYVTTLVHGTFPWVGLLPSALLLVFLGHGKFDDDARQKWFFAAWALSVFSIFTMAGTKLDHYVLPIMPAIAVLLAFAWERFLAADAPRWTRVAMLLAPLFALMPVLDFVNNSNRYIFSVFVPAHNIMVIEEQIVTAVWTVFAAWAVVMLAAWALPLKRLAIVLALLVALGHAGYFLGVVVPAHAEERSMRAYAEAYAEQREPDAELVFYGWIRYTIRYYHGTDYAYFEPNQLDEMVEYVKDKPHVYIIAQGLYIDDMLEQLHALTDSRWTMAADTHPSFSLVKNRPERRVAPGALD